MSIYGGEVWLLVLFGAAHTQNHKIWMKRPESGRRFSSNIRPAVEWPDCQIIDQAQVLNSIQLPP
jgi:hypothetical protein